MLPTELNQRIRAILPALNNKPMQRRNALHCRFRTYWIGEPKCADYTVFSLPNSIRRLTNLLGSRTATKHNVNFDALK